MLKKFITVFVLAISTIVFLPSSSSAATAEKTTTTVTEYNAAPQLRVRIGGRQRRGRNWNRGRRNNNNWNRGHRRSRVVRQVYYRNGRRYVRQTRVWY